MVQAKRFVFLLQEPWTNAGPFLLAFTSDLQGQPEMQDTCGAHMLPWFGRKTLWNECYHHHFTPRRKLPPVWVFGLQHGKPFPSNPGHRGLWRMMRGLQLWWGDFTRHRGKEPWKKAPAREEHSLVAKASWELGHPRLRSPFEKFLSQGFSLVLPLGLLWSCR